MLKPLREALAGWAPQAGARRCDDPLTTIAASWAEVVGGEVARHCEPVKIAGDTLVVATRSSAWSEQLSFLSERILASLRERFGLAQLVRLRFRVGRLPRRTPARVLRGTIPARRRAASERAASASLDDAVARFRDVVTRKRRAKSEAGWKECEACASLIIPGSERLCAACRIAAMQERERLVSRLLFEVPWLGYTGVAALVEGLTSHEYEAIRARLLARWWEILVRARASKRLSRDRREALIASSYVILKSSLEPERIAAVTMRAMLGDELCELLYETGARGAAQGATAL